MHPKYSVVIRFLMHMAAGFAAVTLAVLGPLGGVASQQSGLFSAMASVAAPEVGWSRGHQATSERYEITILSVSGGPESAPPTFYSNNVTLSGNVSATNFAGILGQYHVQVDWGDGTVVPDSRLTLVEAGKSFTGTWHSDPTHAYAQSGNYTIVVTLYHQNYAGAEKSNDAFQSVDVVVIVPPAIAGIVYNDTNGNAVLDAGEGGIGGVTVAISGAQSLVTTTAANGFYHFDNLSSGNYLVVETNRPGYVSTTPDRVYTSAIAGHISVVNFGDNVSNGGIGFVVGTVYDDGSGNGVQDLGEVGLPGVTVAFDGVFNTTTNAYGQYSFGVNPAGIHVVTESDLPGYYSTTPNMVSVNVTLGYSYTRDFGDRRYASGKASVNGIVFNDANGNGIFDQAEAGIGGVGVALSGTDNVSTITSPNGMYLFAGINPGAYIVNETNLSGYKSTTSDEVYLRTVVDSIYVVNFGDAIADNATAFVYGTVFNDANGDAARQLGELGLSGVGVAFNAANAMTNLYGQYTFMVVVSGNYTVVETDPAGYYSTTPNSVPVQVITGDSYQSDFGDTLLSTGSLVLSPDAAVNQLPADAGETFTVTMKDQRGAGIPGLPVVLNTTFGSLSANGVVTGGPGTASFKITSAVAGSATITATLGPLSDTASSTWLPAAGGGGGGGGGGGPPPSPTPTPTPTPSPTPAPQPTPTPEPVLYFRVDFLGRVTQVPMSKEGRLLESLDAPSSDGSHVLRLSPGTLTVDKQGKIVNAIKIRVADEVPVLPADTVLLGKAYDFTPSGIAFDGQVRLSLGYSAGDLPGNVVSVRMVFNTPETGWVDLDTGPGVVAGVGSVTAPIQHFSIFAVLARTAPVSRGTSTGTGPVFGVANLAVTRERDTFWSFFPLIEVDGRAVSFSADVANSGGQKGDMDLVLKIDGRMRGQTRVSLDAAQTQIVNFSVGGNLPGKHRVQLGGLSGEFVTVWTFQWWLVAAVALVVATAGSLIVLYIRRLLAARARVTV